MTWSIYANGTAEACRRQVEISSRVGSDEELALFEKTKAKILDLIEDAQQAETSDSVYVHHVNASGIGARIVTFQFSTQLVLLK